ncbi:MAG: glycosyltransferase family 4 protein [Pyrinomonadaceae bacterium]|nr:glycosyltransferase family 4 protein [Pyrinomonadaceae bacterium]
MRILQLGPVPPPRGGIESNVTAIRELLEREGHESILVGTIRSSEVSKDPNTYQPNSAFELLKLLFTLRYDVAHLHLGGDLTMRLVGLALACSLVPNRKTILTMHSGGFPSSEAGKAATRNSLRGFVMRRFDKIIAVNPAIAEVFERYGVESKKIEIVPPFVHRAPNPNVELPQQFKNFFASHDKVLLSVGLLETHYDLPLQIKVLGEIRRKFPNAGLIIIGSGSQQSDLRERIAATDYAEHIFLTGDVDNQIVLHVIIQADILLRTTIYDGDAISVREALHLGTCVIATDNGMRPAGLKLIEIGNYEQLREAILAELENEKVAKDSTKSGWQNIEKVLDIYRNLLKNNALSKEAVNIPSIQNPKSKIQN